MTTRRTFFALAAAGLAALLAGPTGGAGAAEPIKVGEINSYTRLPAFTLPYRNGWQLAVEEINAAGGVLGRPLEVISRDDGGKPGDAVKIAEELVSKEGVALLAGTFFSHIGLAVTDFAKQRKVFFIAAEPLSDAVTWQKGNHYTFRLRPNTYM
ncbi:MAG: ABC transporter substrate-binding protein, partial [Rhodospirillales bacterium]|nr:ABC transporter substrate-binding protein [Rhodospirillales bacterium]